MRTQNVSIFEQERNQSRHRCILKDLQTVAVVQTVPLCCLGSCSLYVCMRIPPSLLVSNSFHAFSTPNIVLKIAISRTDGPKD